MSASRGFTLVELVIVILLVALFAAGALPSYQSLLTRARRAAFGQEHGGARRPFPIFGFVVADALEHGPALVARAELAHVFGAGGFLPGDPGGSDSERRPA